MLLFAIFIASMYIEKTKSQGKYVCYLLRESYRDAGKVKHRTIANLSGCSEKEIAAMRLALKHKDDLTRLGALPDVVSLGQGPSVGAVWLIHSIARDLKITDALGNSHQGKLALWQVIARVIDQGSRLSAARLAGSHACCGILGLESFNEDDLYANLDWLDSNQAKIEDRLFELSYKDKKPSLYLYDVTSSYLEGQHNELAAFGYNRDGKKGKRQIVIGLLCDNTGKPLSIEVFAGNTSDPSTVACQIRKVAERFGSSEVTFVGDRGMLKSRQVEDINDYGFNYITAITKPQIESLLKQGVIQMELFDQQLGEVQTEDGIRYILRRNPERASQIRQTRDSKLECLRQLAQKQNDYLKNHSRAKADVALRKVNELSEKLRLSGLVTINIANREISVCFDSDAITEAQKLDGCYAIKTDLSKKAASKQTVHNRYKDLSYVERAFRTSKTVELEMRPIHVRLATRTRGHVFVVMLAYMIVQELSKRWSEIDITVSEGINELGKLCATEVRINDKPHCNKIPQPRASARELLDAASVKLPEVLPSKDFKVASRKKLTKRRIRA